MRSDFAKKWTDGGCDTIVLNGRKTRRAPARSLTPADVTRYAMAGTNLQCVRAFSHFCAFLGSAAGDLALTFGGIYIAGGILLRFKEALATSPFRERCERKGRFAGMLAKIPTRLILEESPALLGLAHLPLAG